MLNNVPSKSSKPRCDVMIPKDDRKCTNQLSSLFTGAVVLEISCFSEAERIYMLVKDTTVNDKPLNAVVIPEVVVRDGFEFKICL